MPPPSTCEACQVRPLSLGQNEGPSEVEQLKEQIRELQSIVKLQHAEIEALRSGKDQRIAELEQENAEFKKKLRFYENPNTPPSQQRFKHGKAPEPDAAPKKRGAPKGHRGATRPMPIPTRHEKVVGKHCPLCGSHDLDHKKDEPVTRCREDIERPSTPVVNEYECEVCECRECGHVFIAAHEDCPQEGAFGLHLITIIALLKFGLRGPIRKVGDFVWHAYGLAISPKGILDILRRACGACEAEYERTRQRIAQAAWSYVDETSFSVLKKKFWLWVFRSCDGDILIVLRNSRGADVVREILGAVPRGIGVTDGWRAYNVFVNLQRCWAHLLRQVDDFKDASEHGRLLSDRVHRMFKELKEFLGRDPPMEERMRQKEAWEREMEALVAEFEGRAELHGPVTYIRNGLGSWYTCVAHPGMEPTNNLGEQAIREHVMVRKTIGCFRSDEGARNYQYIASALATWKCKGKDASKELEELLRRELCLKGQS